MTSDDSSRTTSRRTDLTRGADPISDRLPDEDRTPDSLTDLDKQSWKGVLKRTVKEFQDDNGTDWAAALTYYGVLSIFPAIIALISILGLVGEDAADTVIQNIEEAAPDQVQGLLVGTIETVQANPTGSGIALVAGILAALWSASRYVAAFMRASNAIYEIEEGRPVWKTLPVRFGTTVALTLVLAVTAIGVTFTGGLAQQAGNALGLGDTAITVWDYAKWPVLLLIVSLMLALLYWAAPNVKQPGFRWISPGGIVAVIVWVVASALFAVYLANFDNFDATYGALAGVIIFLMWLWITNIAVIVGAEFNAETERGKQMAGGMPEDQEPFLEPRDTRKMDKQKS